MSITFIKHYSVCDSQTVTSSFFIASKIDFPTSLQFAEKSFPVFLILSFTTLSFGFFSATLEIIFPPATKAEQIRQSTMILFNIKYLLCKVAGQSDRCSIGKHQKKMRYSIFFSLSFNV